MFDMHLQVLQMDLHGNALTESFVRISQIQSSSMICIVFLHVFSKKGFIDITNLFFVMYDYHIHHI